MKRDSKHTRSGKLRVDGTERRAWQRAARRSYSMKSSGSNALAISIAKRGGTYGQSPESRIAANAKMQKPDDPAPPTCTTCGSTDVQLPEEFTRTQRQRPVQTTSLLCGQCQGHVVDSLKATLVRSRNWVAARLAAQEAAEAQALAEAAAEQTE